MVLEMLVHYPNILNLLNVNYVISNKDEDIESSTHFILPRVGAFDKVMHKINNSLNTRCYFLKRIKIR